MEKTHKPTKTDWTPQSLKQAVTAGSQADNVELLKRAGILTSDGQIADRYKNWGEKPSRTPDDE